jgi:hypothetical protein
MRGTQAENKASTESSNIYPGTRFSGTVAFRALVKPDDLRAVAGEHSAMTDRKMVRIRIHTTKAEKLNPLPQYAGKDKVKDLIVSPLPPPHP